MDSLLYEKARNDIVPGVPGRVGAATSNDMCREYQQATSCCQRMKSRGYKETCLEPGRFVVLIRRVIVMLTACWLEIERKIAKRGEG